MAYETVVAVFDTAAHAEAAIKALKAEGFADADISLFDEARLKAGKAAIAAGVREAGLWHRLFGRDVHQHEAAVYGQTIQEGGVVVSARVLDSEEAHAIAILDLHRPVDVHDRAVTSGIAPAAHVAAIEKKLDAVPLAPAQQVAVSPKLAAAHDEVLRLAEEQLQVGKQMVESAEHALVSKTARVVEEVGLKKIGTDHVETVHDKLRRQQVEIERVGPGGKVIKESRV